MSGVKTVRKPCAHSYFATFHPMIRTASLVALSALCVVAASATAGGKAPTTVHFTNLYPTGPDSSRYEGSIESPKRACENDRKIKVFKQRSGADKLIGSTRSQPRGQLGYEWVLEVSERLKEGTYYAKAPATDRCKADRDVRTYPA